MPRNMSAISCATSGPASTVTRVITRINRAIRVVHQPMKNGGWVATFEDITEWEEAQQQIFHMARHDALTNLPNRALFRERLERALHLAKRGDQLAVFCLDLDHFKEINDFAGPSRRRCAAEGSRAAGCLRACPRTTPSPGSAATSSPSCCSATAATPSAISALAGRLVEADRRALRCRRPPPRDRRQHRRLAGARGRQRSGSAAEERRPRALSRQGRRPRHLPLLRGRHGRARAGAAPARTRPAHGGAAR